MLESWVEWLIDRVKQFGALGVLFGVLLETFIVPIPSSVIPLAGGSILIGSDFTIQEVIITSFYMIALFGSLGGTVGACFGYVVGRYGGRPFLEKYGRYLGVTWEEVRKIEKKIGGKRIKGLTFILMRAAPIIPLSPVSFFAGIINLNIRKFLLYTFLGCLPRYFILGLVGWWAGVAYNEFVKKLDALENLILVLILLAIFGFVSFYYIKSKRNLNKRNLKLET